MGSVKLDVLKVHVNQLPLKSNYIILSDKFNDILFDKLLKSSGSIANSSRLTGISKSTLGRFFRRENKRIRIDFTLKIIDLLNISLEKIENNIIWIGNNNSQGIVNPKLPFTFDSRASARFLAAICNEGWISRGLYYSNSQQELRDSVKKDALSVFGGNKNTIKDWIKDKDQYLAFPSIMRDVLILITKFKGIKSENNPPVPPHILKNNMLIFGWLEQTIADEGHVKYYPHKYRREIVWRRSFNKNLNETKLNRDERIMLNRIGISYDLKKIGNYTTQKGIKKIKLQMRLSRKENLLKLSKLILIPHTKKQQIFNAIVNSF